jgi:predicted RNA-binding Zn ribbon-like protein
MTLHIPSFLLGYGAGAGTVFLAKRLRPVLVELATTGYRFFDTIGARAAMTQEDLEDLLAEAKARARSVVRAAQQPMAEPEARE